jgi:hypothetical protein
MYIYYISAYFQLAYQNNLWLFNYTRFLAARKLAPLQRQPTSTLVGKARTNHVRVTVFYGFLASMLYRRYRSVLSISNNVRIVEFLMRWNFGRECEYIIKF